MQYLLLLYANESGWDKMSQAEQQAGYAAYMSYTKALQEAMQRIEALEAAK